MRASKTILASVALLVAPLSLQADDSFKGTYQFGTGSQGQMTHELTLDDAYRDELITAYDSRPAGGERAEMAVLEAKQVSPSGPSVRGFIGSY